MKIYTHSLLTGCVLLLSSPTLAEVSSPRQIADRPSAHCQSPKWSPDGLQIAFDVYEPKKDQRETWIMRFGKDGRKSGEEEIRPGQGGGARNLLGDGARKAPVVEFAWAPDMKLLNKPYVFSSRGPNKSFEIFADGTWLTKNPGNDGQPAWSSDGRFIAFTSQQRQSGDIMMIDLHADSQEPVQITPWPDATEFEPQWAPGKNMLLFVRSQSGGNKGQDIGVVQDVLNPKATTRMLVAWDGDEIRPAWSPDASKIAFLSNKGNANDKVFDLWTIQLDGSDAKKLDTDVVWEDGSGPVWSPDGSTLFYVKRDFKNDNPVYWTRQDGSQKGELNTGTQLNGDLSLIAGEGGEIKLAFKALGQKGSTEKTWERLYVVTFTMADLQAAP